MRFNKFQLTSIALSTFLLVGCASNLKSDTAKLREQLSAVVKEPSQDSTIVKVYVNKDSQIRANGKLVTLSELDTLLQKVPLKAGIVYYSRFNAQAYEGPQTSLKVLDVVIKYHLPLRFYMDSTFSEAAPMN